MLPITLASALQKHQVASTSPWYVLLDVYPNKNDLTTVLRLVRNTDPVTFGGNVYEAFNFDIDSITESTTGALPNVVIRVSNVNRAVQGQLELYSGGIGAQVVLTVVNAADLAGDPAQQYTWDILEATADEMWVTFTLGAPNPMRKPFPFGVYLRSHCLFVFNTPAMQLANDPRGCQCGYQGSTTSCDLTLNGANGCRAKGNQARFGAFPGIDTLGFRSASAI
jgi:phage-related protein